MRTSLLVILLACGCATPSTSTGSTTRSAANAASIIAASTGPAATALIEPRSGSALSGTARFTTVPNGLGVHVEVHGAAPGLHGVHIHEKGNCSDPTAANAGGHYDPGGGPRHGGPDTPSRHGGDLGSIEVAPDGTGTLDVLVSELSIDRVADGVAGRALVVHEMPDDLRSDPEGNAGARIGCGVIVAPSIQ